jgi:hypothetical protein
MTRIPKKNESAPRSFTVNSLLKVEIKREMAVEELSVTMILST